MAKRSNRIVVVLIALLAAGGCSTSDDDSAGPETTNSGANMGGAGGAIAMPGMPGGAAGNTMTGMSPPAVGGGSGGSAGSATAGSGGSGMQPGGDVMADSGAMQPEVPDSGAPPAEETCDKTVPSSMSCDDPLAPGDERHCMLGSREYILYAPKNLNLCKPTALVIDAHGATETAAQQAGEEEFCATGGICWHGLGSGWKAEADQPGAGFVAVFPQGVGNVWQQSDADFMVQIVDAVKKIADIDPAKVYISGISNGGALTYWTGCPHSDVFHGMSPNAGASNCTSVAQPIPVIAFDDMPDFAYQGSVDAIMGMVSTQHCMGAEKTWVTVDNHYDEAVCRSAKEDTMATLVPCSSHTDTIEPTVCKMWDQCDGGIEIVFCEVAANTEHGASNASLDGHIIYENNTILNTPSLAWRFFKRFWK